VEDLWVRQDGFLGCHGGCAFFDELNKCSRGGCEFLALAKFGRVGVSFRCWESFGKAVYGRRVNGEFDLQPPTPIPHIHSLKSFPFPFLLTSEPVIPISIISIHDPPNRISCKVPYLAATDLRAFVC
jgi:hypothetical protein